MNKYKKIYLLKYNQQRMNLKKTTKMIVKFSHPHYLKIGGGLHARLPAFRVTPKF